MAARMSPVINPVVSIIIPMLNESDIIVAKLQLLQHLRPQCELIIVDGGSCDGGVDLAKNWADRVLESPAGRAKQMNAGAAVASADLLLFLHLDTQLPDKLLMLLANRGLGTDYWGRFDVTIDGQHWMLPIVGFFMNLRSRVTGIATGDQGIFISRSLFNEVGGFPDQLLMEDVEISKRLLKEVRPICIKKKVITSGRRWEQKGVVRTICLMWSLRWAYWRGGAPDLLAERYGYRVGKQNK